MTVGQRMAVREARIPVRDGTELAATLCLPAQPPAVSPRGDDPPQPAANCAATECSSASAPGSGATRDGH
jgi:hypothetical protein